jgi:hypothetical protein
LKKSAILFVLTAALAGTALAGNVITLTFEGLQNEEAVDSYYDGGTGGNGSGPGPNYGITFTSDSLALTSGNFEGAPSMPTILFFESGAGDTMDVAAGFTTGFSFYYSAPVYAGDVLVYSGLDGTGTLLATVTLPLTPDGSTYTGGGCPGGPDYCPFEPAGVSFAGTAQSAVFSGVANFIGFDNITLGASTPTGSSAPSGVPEPATVALLGGGLGLVALLRRFRKA